MLLVPDTPHHHILFGSSSYLGRPCAHWQHHVACGSSGRSWIAVWRPFPQPCQRRCRLSAVKMQLKCPTLGRISRPLLRRFRVASMKRHPSPAPRLTKTASAMPASTASRGPPSGYLSGIKAAAAASAAMSTFAATSQAIANAVPPGRSPIDIVDLLGTPSHAPAANHHAQHRSPRTPSQLLGTPLRRHADRARSSCADSEESKHELKVKHLLTLRSARFWANRGGNIHATAAAVAAAAAAAAAAERNMYSRCSSSLMMICTVISSGRV